VRRHFQENLSFLVFQTGGRYGHALGSSYAHFSQGVPVIYGRYVALSTMSDPIMTFTTRDCAKRVLAPILRMWHFKRINNLYVLRAPPKYLQAYYGYCSELMQESLRHSRQKETYFLITCEFTSIMPRGAKYVLIQFEHAIVSPDYESQRIEILANVTDGPYLEKYSVRLIGNIQDYRNAFAIIDYSRANIVHVSNSPLSGLYSTKVIYIPPVFTELNERWLFSSQQRTAVTMFGNPGAGRRKSFLESMKLRAIQVSNLMGDYLNYGAIFKGYGILINVHQTDSHHTLEELRLLPALASGLRVISEESPYLEVIPCAEFITFGAISELADIVIHLQRPQDGDQEGSVVRQRFCDLYTKWQEENRVNMQALLNPLAETSGNPNEPS
jgi:hypothetical protein